MRIGEADYTYNDAGVRDTLTDLASVHDYSYDTDGHLTGVDNPDGGLPDEAYTYDALGNLTSWPNNPAAQVKHSAADQLTQDATNTYGYDNEGNQVTKRNRTTGDTATYMWNAAHQLTKITNPDGSTVQYGYGPLGRRLTATTTPAGSDSPSTKAFVWAGGNLRATLDTTGALVNRNITTPDLNGTLAVTTPQGTDYPLKDGLGSTTATTNTTGTVTSTTAYSAYGIPTGTSGTDTGIAAVAGYTGHQTDPGGLIYARARYYNPQTGRFLSQDPVTSVGRYKYANNSPENRNDPTGTIGEDYIPLEESAESAATAGTNSCTAISLLDAFDILIQFVGLGAAMVPSGWNIPAGYRFYSITVDDLGRTVMRQGRLDVNPADSHVGRSGAHLNLEEWIDGVETPAAEGNHTPIDPDSVLPTGFPC